MSKIFNPVHMQAILGLCIVLAGTHSAMGNNMRILDPEPKIVEINNAGHYATVEFSLAWDNSWRTSDAPYNWDAAWVFMKWRRESEPTAAWSHCKLAPAIHHIIPAGFSTSQPSDNTGIFIYHSNNTSGPVTATLNNVRLRWDFSAIGPFEAGEKIEIKVYATEMVYVPEGSFYVGDGNTNYGQFYTYGSNSPYQITGENEINISTSNGSLYYNLEGLGWTGDQGGPIPNEFPKGFRSFYCMKYEITQGLYVDFLNSLSRGQQNARTYNDISVTQPEKRYINATNDDIPFRHNGIRCDEILHPTNPVTFYCDLNRYNPKNEFDDGQSIGNVFMNWEDFTAVLDWMALRPMTELEFEKAARGTEYPVQNEYAWGNTTLVAITNLSDRGDPNESPSNTDANTTYGNLFTGPIRVGAFAYSGSNRVQSGASFYGVMDLTGNVNDRVVSIGRPVSRTFAGDHGDGELDYEGKANVNSWPANTIGTGFRGGAYSTLSNQLFMMQTSNRRMACMQYLSDDGRGHSVGGRGVRTLP